jgi:hypothetical protein
MALLYANSLKSEDQRSLPKGANESVNERQPLTAMEEKAIIRRVDLWYVTPR